jgi:hypothetical protein
MVERGEGPPSFRIFALVNAKQAFYMRVLGVEVGPGTRTIRATL